MRTIVIEPTFEAWRGRARELLLEGVPPEQVLWSDEAEEPCLFGAEPAPSSPSPPALAGPSLKVSSAFMDLARTTAAHTAASRWGALYRLLWRQTRGGEPHVLALATDPDVRQIQGWAGAVRRDIHKMHAFVRFRLADTDETTGREYFVAWFEPDYRIVPLATPFFKKRFASMDWSILTPHACAPGMALTCTSPPASLTTQSSKKTLSTRSGARISAAFLTQHASKCRPCSRKCRKNIGKTYPKPVSSRK